ncbi:MAG: site-2 protease family protein [Deltaproteobacteria bacterium]|nr:site-2 protease family protein [Deltaproteobacteria bacterium]
MFSRSIRIGRLFGIDFKVDSSWLVIAALVAFSLTTLFGRWHPTWTQGTSLAVALVAAASFFVSLLLHELAHAVVARFVYGIPVRDITLHMFGGVASIEREPETPGAELFIAIVGPLTSLALGVVMLVGAALLTGAPVQPDQLANLSPAETMLMWLGPVNIGIALFNLIPGFPLDGGRILRAILWKVTGNPYKATHWASSVGQTVGLSFIIGGIAMALGFQVPFFGRGFGSGLWLAMIGMFLRGAAQRQEASTQLRALLEGVRVGDVMRPYLGWSRPVEVPGSHVSPDDALTDALPELAGTPERQVPVVENGMLVGMLFQDDVSQLLSRRFA